MTFDKIPHNYEDNQYIDYKDENVNHKFLERNVWYHTHDGTYGSEFENLKVSGTLTTEKLIVHEKSNLLDLIKHWDSGWKTFDTIDFDLDAGSNHDIRFYTKIYNHNLGVLPTMAFIQSEAADANTNVGIKNEMSDTIRSQHDGHRYQIGAELGNITANSCTLKVGSNTGIDGYSFRILLLV